MNDRSFNSIDLMELTDQASTWSNSFSSQSGIIIGLYSLYENVSDTQIL